MNIPRFWARTAATVRGPGGDVEAAAWGWSSAGSDPAFLTLCRAQESFRARLTPKPWRCDQQPPPTRHPREDTGSQQAFAAWLAGYEAACRSRATCRFLEAVGWNRVHREVGPLLELHDRATRAVESLPLA